MQTAESVEVVDPVDPEIQTAPEDPALKVDPDNPEEYGEVEITLGDAVAPTAEEDDASAPEWVRNLRKENRELKRWRAEQEKKQSSTAEPEAPKVGQRPTLEDHDFDEEAYNAALDKWYADKKAADDHKAAQQRKADEAKEAQQKVQDAYKSAAQKLRVPDFKAAEDTVVESLSEVQQGIILHGSDDPAKLVYVLGKYPEKLKQLASIANPTKFAFAVAKLERDVKVTPRNKPAPESTVTGGSGSRVTGDAKLEELRKKAQSGGDVSELLAYQRKLREQKAKR